MPTSRNELVRALAKMDQVIAEAEELIFTSGDELWSRVEKTLLELRASRREVEAQLKASE